MNWLKDPTPAGLMMYLVILCIISAVVVVAVSPARADPIPPATLPTDIDGEQGRTSQASRVEAMITSLVESCPRHPMNRSDWGAKMAEQIVTAASKYSIPVDLVTAISFRESSLRWDVIGPGGEIGIMQVHPGTVRRFACDMSTVAGQVDCGCKVLAWHHDRCGSDWEAALAAYGSRTAECNPKAGSKLRRMVKDRFRLAARLREVGAN